MMIQIDPKETPTAKLHGYLLGGVGPRPIAFASTIDEQGRPNLSPFSFFNVFSANPPIAVFSPARRVRDNTTKHTLQNAEATREVVINVVNHSIVQQMSLSSTEYGDGVDEFVKAGFTKLESEKVSPFRVKESPMHLECKVNEIVSLGDQGGAGNLIICEVVMVHVNEAVLDENGRIDPHKMDLVGRLGGNWYCRAGGDTLFEVEKPLQVKGIGVDQIPADIRNSRVLTGNHLGQLGNVAAVPDETDVNEYKLIQLADVFQEYDGNMAGLEQELHRRAAQLLDQGEVTEAWKALLTFNN